MDRDESGFRFEYLPHVVTLSGFRPLIGFPDVSHVYESDRLWPFFALRVIDPKRPDRPAYLARLGLPADADDLDVLSRSGGELQGDTIFMAEEPLVDADGRTESTFLVRGMKYATRQNDSAEDVAHLEPDDQLGLVHDVENPVNAAAISLVAARRPIGWVPDLLITYVDAIRAAGGVTATVLRNNGVESAWHLRLLIKIAGHAPIDYRAFSDTPWPPPKQAVTLV